MTRSKELTLIICEQQVKVDVLANILI